MFAATSTTTPNCLQIDSQQFRLPPTTQTLPFSSGFFFCASKPPVVFSPSVTPTVPTELPTAPTENHAYAYERVRGGADFGSALRLSAVGGCGALWRWRGAEGGERERRTATAKNAPKTRGKGRALSSHPKSKKRAKKWQFSPRRGKRATRDGRNIAHKSKKRPYKARKEKTRGKLPPRSQTRHNAEKGQKEKRQARKPAAVVYNSVTIASAPPLVVCAVAVCFPFFKSFKSRARSARLALCPFM